MAGDARALRAERLLHHLDEHLLPFFQQVFDARPIGPPPSAPRVAASACAVAALVARWPLPCAWLFSPFVGAATPAARARRRQCSSAPSPLNACAAAAAAPPRRRSPRRRRRLLVVFERLEHLLRIDDVRHVQEAVALEAEVDERGLHAGQHFRDAALVDVADDPAIPLALDEEFDQLVVLEDGHRGFVVVRGDNHFLRHGGRPHGRTASGAAQTRYARSRGVFRPGRAVMTRP